MKYKLADICDYVKSKVDVSKLNRLNYISTENMLPNKDGIIPATTLPTTIQTQEYHIGDILVSNIRPYFKKIWYAKENGGCSNDVLVFRAKKNILSKFLYYVLSNDKFFEYAMATSKGTKMPRGDKKALMKYELPVWDFEKQKKIVSILSSIDEKINLNKKINDNFSEVVA